MEHSPLWVTVSLGGLVVVPVMLLFLSLILLVEKLVYLHLEQASENSSPDKGRIEERSMLLLARCFANISDQSKGTPNFKAIKLHSKLSLQHRKYFPNTPKQHPITVDLSAHYAQELPVPKQAAFEPHTLGIAPQLDYSEIAIPGFSQAPPTPTHLLTSQRNVRPHQWVGSHQCLVRERLWPCMLLLSLVSARGTTHIRQINKLKAATIKLNLHLLQFKEALILNSTRNPGNIPIPPKAAPCRARRGQPVFLPFRFSNPPTEGRRSPLPVHFWSFTGFKMNPPSFKESLTGNHHNSSKRNNKDCNLIDSTTRSLGKREFEEA
nr:hypothetical protein Iba_chr01fCG1360 [Ipomoea batatas]